MLKSDVVDVQGTFVGAAITYAERDGVVFVAAHDAARALDGCRFASLESARAAAARGWHAVATSANQVRLDARADALASPAQCSVTGLPASASSCA